MKFHNQKSFMGHEISNVTNKPLLHKKGKQWIVVAVSALILAGFGGMVSTTTHADTIQPAATTKVAQPSQNNGNSSKVVPTSNPTKNNPSVTQSNNKPVVHMLGGSNPVATPAPNDELAPTDASEEASGMWGNAYWNFYSNGQLDIHDGHLNHVNDFNGYNGSDPTNKSTNTLNPNDVKSIKTYNAVAPENASGLFSGDNGSMQNDGTGNPNNQSEWNHFNNVKSIDLSGLDTSNTTNMSSMFHGDLNLSQIKFGNFKTNNVTNMDAMFDDDRNITSLNLHTFDTRNCHNFAMMFFDMPNLQLLDIYSFVINPSLPNFDVSGMFELGGSNSHLQELVVGPHFSLPSSDVDGANQTVYDGSGQSTYSGFRNHNMGNSSTFTNPLLGSSNNTIYDFQNIVDRGYNDSTNSNYAPNGVWINSTNNHTYTVTFKNKDDSNATVGKTATFQGPSGATFLPVNGIKFPQGYSVDPTAGSTAVVTSSNGPYTAYCEVIPNSNVSATGSWGNADWILYNNGHLALKNGSLETNQVPNTLLSDANNVTSIKTQNIVAPNPSNNLFRDFPNATSVDLSGLDESNIINNNNIQDMLSNFARIITLGAKSKLYAPNGLLAYNYKDNNQDTNIADGTTNHQGTWIIDYAGTMSAEASADAQSAERAANTSASNTFTSASNWVSNNSNSAQSADSWVTKNSQNESNASTNASNNSNWIANHSNSLASAYNSATSAMTSLNNDSAELNWLANSENVLSSGTSQASSNAQWIKDNSASVQNINNQINTLNTKISNDNSALNTAINTKADSASVSNDEKVLSGTLTHDINDLDALDEQANSLASADENWINTNKANISNNSKNINTNSKTAASGISNDNASATASASIANANADSYALSLANNATNTANENAGGIDGTMNSNYNVVQSLSNTVNANTASLADNENNLYQTKENKPVKKHIKKQSLFYFYVIKPIWLHTNAKFTKGNRAKALPAKHGYTVAINRIFKVNGALRFEIRLHGKNYFVTGLKNFVQNAYIQPKEINKHSSVKLLGAVREYKKAGFGKKNFIRYFKKGSVLPVKRVKTVAGKEFTRLQLTNGHWITANKNLVKLI